MPTCGDIMTKDPVCCEPGDGVTAVAEVMKAQDVGSVPVVDSRASRRLVGIVTDRDLVTKIVAGGRPVAGATVRDAMTKAKLPPEHAELTMRAESRVPVEGETAESLVKLIDVLEDLDDVQTVYTNADIAAEALEATA